MHDAARRIAGMRLCMAFCEQSSVLHVYASHNLSMRLCIPALSTFTLAYRFNFVLRQCLLFALYL